MAGSLLKYILASAGYYSGLLRFVAHVRLNKRAIILMYHRVAFPEEKEFVPVQPGMYVTPKTFRSHLKLLRSEFHMVSLSELVDRIENKKDISRCCVLTFDDGWYDNYQRAFPLLKEFHAPATIFLASSFIGTDYWFWPEETSYVIAKVMHGQSDVNHLPSAIREVLADVQVSDQGLEYTIDSVIEYLKKMPSERRVEVVQQLQGIRQQSESSYRLLMNWNEVREMKQSGLVEFGSHTVNHELLDQLSPLKVREEVEWSCAHIAKETKAPCTLFAYPNGNFNDDVVQCLKKIGINAAVTTRRGNVSVDIDELALPRIAIHEDISSTAALFLWRLLVQ